MSNKFKVVSYTMMIALFLNGCSTIEEDTSSTKDKITSEIKKNIDDKQIGEIIVSNSNSEMNDKLINSIEIIEKEEVPISKEERYDLRAELFTTMNSDQIQNFSNCYAVLTSIIADDRYKELFDKNSSRWDSYDDNNLYGITDVMISIYSVTTNQEFKNDINRINELCLYGLKNRDVVALIDARRIIRDIKYHVFEVPYFKEGDAIVEVNEDDYNIYYGASELLQGDLYRIIGVYNYN